MHFFSSTITVAVKIQIHRIFVTQTIEVIIHKLGQELNSEQPLGKCNKRQNDLAL